MGGQIWKTSTNLHLSARLFELLLRSLSLILRYPSLTVFGNEVVNSLASFNPNDVKFRITLRTATRLSLAMSSKITSNVVFSSTTSAGSPPTMVGAGTPHGASIHPKVSSIRETKSVASSRVIVLI
jgi:hypothetical protein